MGMGYRAGDRSSFENHIRESTSRPTFANGVFFSFLLNLVSLFLVRAKSKSELKVTITATFH
jgi:hypothetical protein